MKARRPDKQGTGDGLCGLYALSNYLKHDPRFAEPDELWDPMWYLLEAMQSEGFLQPHYIWQGLETYHLKAVFDRVCKRLELPHLSCSIATLLRRQKKRGAIDVATDVVDQGGALVAGFEGEAHWFLVHGRTKQLLLVDDSAPNAGRLQMNMNRASQISDDGLVLLKAGSPLAELVNAQAH